MELNLQNINVFIPLGKMSDIDYLKEQCKNFSIADKLSFYSQILSSQEHQNSSR